MRVDIDGDRIVIEIVLDDPVTARLLEGSEDRPALLADIIEVGARVYQRAQDGAAGEFLRREVDHLEQTVLDAQADLAQKIGGDLGSAVQEVFSIVGDTLVKISGQLDGALAVASKDVELAAEQERGTAKGRTYEEQVATAVEVIAAAQGDSCEHVGDIAGAGGKVGDVVIEIDGARGPTKGRVVFEAKASKLSRPEALRQLDQAREQRVADFAVLVVAPDKTPSQMRDLREYNGDKIVVVFDSEDETAAVALEFAYSIARARVLMNQRKSGGEIDVDAIEAAVERAAGALEEVRRVRSSLTSATSSIEQARVALDSLVAATKTHIESIAMAISQEAEQA